MNEVYICHYESSCTYHTKQSAELVSQTLAFEWFLTKTTTLSGSNFKHVPVKMSIKDMNDILIEFGMRRVAYSRFKQVK